MKITMLTQPFDEKDNPIRLGDILIELLISTTPFYNNIWIVSAFANQQAILRLLPHLQTAISRGADIWLVVGVDHKATSIEALQEVLDIDADVKIAHNRQPGHTFHPKVYLFEAEGEKAELFVGSNNLTTGGLFTNYEVSTHISFDFPEDEDEYNKIKHSLNRIFNPPDVIIQTLDEKVIENLEAWGKIVTEAQRQEATKQSSKPRISTADKEVPEALFGSESIKKPPRLPEQYLSRVALSTPTDTSRGKLVWEKKKLPVSDLEQSKQGNPIGGLKFTQARWKIGGQVVDQTKYFRETLFGRFEWSVGKRKPTQQETTVVVFDVYILGSSYGLYGLTISHKPSGEAGQGNYTTKLHWGGLAGIIKDPNLVDRTFRLYAPAENSNIFTIEII